MKEDGEKFRARRRKAQLHEDVNFLYGEAILWAASLAPEDRKEFERECKAARGRLEAFIREAEVPGGKKDG